MTQKIHRLFMVLALLAGVYQAAAQGTAFTYQERLNDGANPAAGIYDLRFTIRSVPEPNRAARSPTLPPPSATACPPSRWTSGIKFPARTAGWKLARTPTAMGPFPP